MQCHASTAATGGNGPRGCSAKLRHLPDATFSPVGGMKMQCHASTAATGGNGPRGCSAKLRHLPDPTPTPSSSTTGGPDGEEPHHVTSNPAPVMPVRRGVSRATEKCAGGAMHMSGGTKRKGRTPPPAEGGRPQAKLRRDNRPGDRAHASPKKTRTPKSSRYYGEGSRKEKMRTGDVRAGQMSLAKNNSTLTSPFSSGEEAGESSEGSEDSRRACNNAHGPAGEGMPEGLGKSPPWIKQLPPRQPMKDCRPLPVWGKIAGPCRCAMYRTRPVCIRIHSRRVPTCARHIAYASAMWLDASGYVAHASGDVAPHSRPLHSRLGTQ